MKRNTREGSPSSPPPHEEESSTSPPHLQSKCLCMCFSSEVGGEKPGVFLSIRGIPAISLVNQQDISLPIDAYFDLRYSDGPIYAYNSTVRLGSKLYGVGGLKHYYDEEVIVPDGQAEWIIGSDPTDVVLSIDMNKWVHSVEPSLIAPKMDPALVVMDDKIYTILGNPAMGGEQPYFEYFDPANDTKWRADGLPPPPFLHNPESIAKCWCSIVVVRGVLHVSTAADSYCFDPKVTKDDRKWGKSDLFADYPYSLAPPSVLHNHIVVNVCKKIDRGTQGGRPFDFMGYGMVLSLGDHQNVLIATHPLYGLVAVLLRDGKVVARQIIRQFSPALHLLSLPYTVDLGGDGLFSTVWLETPQDAIDKNPYLDPTISFLNVWTCRIKMLQGFNMGSDFLGVDTLNHFSYTFDFTNEHEPWLFQSLGCFLLDPPKSQTADSSSTALDEMIIRTCYGICLSSRKFIINYLNISFKYII